jgi:hypothetical protein
MAPPSYVYVGGEGFHITNGPLLGEYQAFIPTLMEEGVQAASAASLFPPAKAYSKPKKPRRITEIDIALLCMVYPIATDFFNTHFAISIHYL